ncbi:hypothetical protein HY486_03240 [Candidatus Woesearchaeota archaeon]|nr:hypothetical protein [Candidatus Woesearchaeota archaeon]
MNYALMETRIRRMEEDATKLWVESGKEELDEDNLAEIAEKYLFQEEGVVHGLLDRFVLERKDELGISDAKLTSNLRHGDEKRYSLAEMIREKAGRVSPQEVMRRYLHCPEELFGK